MIPERLLPEAAIELIVGPEMRAAFDGEVVHEVYGTAPMVGHMELAARHVILAAREENEEGIGYRVEATHLAPAPVGSRVTVTARLRGVEGNRITCEVEACTRRGLIGRGIVVQVILPRETLRRRFEEYARGTDDGQADGPVQAS